MWNTCTVAQCQPEIESVAIAVTGKDLQIKLYTWRWPFGLKHVVYWNICNQKKRKHQPKLHMNEVYQKPDPWMLQYYIMYEQIFISEALLIHIIQVYALCYLTVCYMNCFVLLLVHNLVLKLLCSGMWLCSLVDRLFYPEGGGKFLLNVVTYLPNYMVSYPRRQFLYLALLSKP
jgi:hypothetical protein